MKGKESDLRKNGQGRLTDSHGIGGLTSMLVVWLTSGILSGRSCAWLAGAAPRSTPGAAWGKGGSAAASAPLWSALNSETAQTHSHPSRLACADSSRRHAALRPGGMSRPPAAEPKGRRMTGKETIKKKLARRQAKQMLVFYFL